MLDSDPRVLNRHCAPRAGGGAAMLLLFAASLGAAPQPAQVPSAAAQFSPPVVPTARDLEAAGWTPREERLPEVEIVQPQVPVQRGASLLASQPDLIPRPSARLGEALVPLPLAARQQLFERRETGAGPLLVWTPRIDLRHAGGRAWVLGIDVRPFTAPVVPDQADVQSAFRHGERRLAAAPLAATNQLQVSPERRFRLEGREPAPSDVPLPSGLRLRALAAPVAEDALLVTLDDGDSWWEVVPETAQGARDRHSWDATRVFVDGERIYLAARALAPDAARELLLFEPPHAQAQALPFPTPVGAAWRCELSDLRRRGDGLEALVLVHDPKLRRAPEQRAADSWAARLRMSEGRWTEVERVALPGDARALRIAFEPAGGGVLLRHEKQTLGRRAFAKP